MAEPHYFAGGGSLPGPSARRRPLLPPVSKLCSTPRTRRSTSSSTRTRTATALVRVDLAVWHVRDRAPVELPRDARPRGRRRSRLPSSVTGSRLDRTRSAASTNASTSATTWSVRPTKKWLAPATSRCASSSTSRGLGLDLVRRRGTRRARRARAASGAGRRRPRRTRLRAGSAAAARSPTQPAIRASSIAERHVGAERPADDASGVRRGRRRPRRVERGDDVERLVATFAVLALAGLDAAEVEAQARDPAGGQGLEQRRDHDAAHACRRTAGAGGRARRGAERVVGRRATRLRA